MKNSDAGRDPVGRYFAGLTESTFQSHLGVADPNLVDYLSDLLIRFIRSDVVHRIRSVTGRRLMSVDELIAEATERLGDAKRELHQHIGDFTLFWAGVYPESLRSGGAHEEKFENYRSFGKRSYKIASAIESLSHEAVPGRVLERLSERFDLCCYGLREVRRQWEENEGSDNSGTILLN